MAETVYFMKVQIRHAPSHSLDSQETAGYGNGERAGMRNKMAEDRGGTSDLSHLQRANSEMWRHRWIFPPVTPSRLCQSYCNARELTERAVPANLARAARETSLRFNFYLLSRLVSFSHRSLNQFLEQTLQMSPFVPVPFKSYRNERAIMGHEYNFPQKGKEFAILTHAAARVSCTRRTKLTSTR